MSAVVPDVAIVTHNTDYYLLNLLKSLEPLQAAHSIGDVFVWDNASIDDTSALLDAYAAERRWLRAHRSPANVHHGPALDRLLRHWCHREWVLVLDSDTEVRQPFASALNAGAIHDAAFVGQLHPQMPHLYAYLAHLLVHRTRYLDLPPFRHHGAPGIDYFLAIEREQRPYVRFRWCDYVHHFGQGALRRLVARGDRANEFYEFAKKESLLRPTPPSRRQRELALQNDLQRFLRETPVIRQSTPQAEPAMAIATRRAGNGPLTRRRIVRTAFTRWTDVLSVKSLKHVRALRAARRLGLTQIAREASALMRIVEPLRPRRVLEIGTAHGGSFLLWARAATADATLVSIDLPPWELDDPGEAEKRSAIERVASRAQSVHLVRGNSHDAEVRACAVAHLDRAPVDFLFIDGDHSYAGVERDYLDYTNLVRPGGIVAWHDIHPHSRGWGGEVPRFWREIRQRYRHLELIANPQQDGFGIGVIWMPP